jgi:hypothetical protein
MFGSSEWRKVGRETVREKKKKRRKRRDENIYLMVVVERHY